MPSHQTAAKSSSGSKKCRVSISLDKATLKLLDAWCEPIAFAATRSRGVEALVGIALGDARWGKNSPGFGAAWTPTSGYEVVPAHRPDATNAAGQNLKTTSKLPSRTTSTGRVLQLLPSGQ